MKNAEKDYSVEFMSEFLEVSRSGYYAWRSRNNSEREAKDLKLLRAIEDVHKASRKNYGSPRIFKQLKGMGHNVGKAKIERTMKMHGIRAKTKRKFRVTTDSKHKLPVAPNHLDRNFSPEKPNQVWASDITYIWTRQGWLFLAVIVDLFSRQVVGWSLDKTMTKELVCSALRQAYFCRRPGTGLIFHSDRGSQYCSKEFRKILKEYRMLQSQSRLAKFCRVYRVGGAPEGAPSSHGTVRTGPYTALHVSFIHSFSGRQWTRPSRETTLCPRVPIK